MESFETFKKLGPYERTSLLQKDPSRGSKSVRVVKYKVTVEKIDEPLDVIRARIRKLWEERDDWQDPSSLLAAAKDYNIVLK